MFTYFYNKFRPVNHTYYIKCGVNSSLVTQFWLLHKVCGTLDHCFITTHSIHKEGDILQIYFCVIFRETRHHARAHVTSGALIHCALSLSARRTQMAEQLGWFRWLVFVTATSAEACCCCCSSSPSSSKQSSNITSFRTWFWVGVSNKNFIIGFLLKFYLFFSGHCSRPTIVCLV